LSFIDCLSMVYIYMNQVMVVMEFLLSLEMSKVVGDELEV